MSPNDFTTTRIPLLAGRLITDADDSTSEHVTIINQAMAKKFFGDANPLGRRLRELGMDSHRNAPMTDIGDRPRGPRAASRSTQTYSRASRRRWKFASDRLATDGSRCSF
ncbi:MAG TPA: hypothetical protein VIP11_17705 [Gemmatimonadaceae bacterium]